MRLIQAVFLDSDHYSSLPLPEPRPLPPQASLTALQNRWLPCPLGKIRGRTHYTAPANPPMNGIGRGSTLTISHRRSGSSGIRPESGSQGEPNTGT
jgi:hypothetical protein